MMIAPTEILFFRWVTLTEQKWVTFRERRSNKLIRNGAIMFWLGVHRLQQWAYCCGVVLS
jgi:hypothetical protein